MPRGVRSQGTVGNNNDTLVLIDWPKNFTRRTAKMEQSDMIILSMTVFRGVGYNDALDLMDCMQRTLYGG